jgi:hypothetical protein
VSVTPVDLLLELTLTQAEFVLSKSRYPWIIGPEREGKTFASIAAFFAFLQEVRPYLPVHQNDDPAGKWRKDDPFDMRGAFIRDTHINLKRITVDSIKRSPFGDICEFHDDYHKLYADGMDIDLFGMDAPDSLNRIQGAEYQIIHLEEPAPIIHTGNQGMREEVYLMGMRRVAAGGTGPKRLQVAMNPAERKHWTYKWAIERPATGAEVYRIRKGENPHISQTDRDARVEAFRNRPDLAARYDEGEFSDVYDGVRITEEYQQQFHLAKHRIDPLPEQQILRMYDGGLNPTCVLAQFTPSGRLHFLDSVMLPGGGMHQMITTKLQPLLAQPRYARCKKWYDGGDPALESREQSNSDYSGARIIEDLLKTVYHPGVSDWQTRKNALKFIFTQMPGGIPMVQVSPHVTEGEPFNRVDAAFAGGYSYKVNAMGEVLKDGPDKKQPSSHVGDSITHVLGRVLFRPQEKPTPRSKDREKQRSKGYSVS